MNNAVGYARPARFDNPVVLGTDGIGADMLEEFRLGYARLREDDVTATPDVAWQWLENGYALVPEARADRVTWAYEPVDPWRLAFTPGVRALDVVVDGETVLAAGRPTRVDADEIRARAAEQARPRCSRSSRRDDGARRHVPAGRAPDPRGHGARAVRRGAGLRAPCGRPRAGSCARRPCPWRRSSQ